MASFGGRPVTELCCLFGSELCVVICLCHMSREFFVSVVLCD